MSGGANKTHCRLYLTDKVRNERTEHIDRRKHSRFTFAPLCACDTTNIIIIIIIDEKS